MAPFTITVAPNGHALHHSGDIGDAGIGIALLAGLTIGIVAGAAPGALIAHYAFGASWGKSILIGLGTLIAFGMIQRATTPPAPLMTPGVPTTA